MTYSIANGIALGFITYPLIKLLSGKAVSYTHLNRPIVREATSLGCFYLAGLKSGIWNDVKELKGKTEIEKVFLPEKDNSLKIKNYKRWQNAIKSVISWHESF